VNVCLASCFRDSMEYIGRYFDQATALRDALAARGDSLHLALVYGDCVDDTAAWLDAICKEPASVRFKPGEITVTEHATGLPYFGQRQSPERFRVLAGVGNAVLANVPPDADVMVYAESDLIWEPEAALALIADLALPDVALAFPMVFIKGTTRFYDTWAYRVGEKPFNPFWPHHPALVGGGLVELTGAGSFAVVGQPALADLLRIGFPAWDCWPGLTRALAAEGWRSWVDTRVTVWHPYCLPF